MLHNIVSGVFSVTIYVCLFDLFERNEIKDNVTFTEVNQVKTKKIKLRIQII